MKAVDCNSQILCAFQTSEQEAQLPACLPACHQWQMFSPVTFRTRHTLQTWPPLFLRTICGSFKRTVASLPTNIILDFVCPGYTTYTTYSCRLLYATKLLGATAMTWFSVVQCTWSQDQLIRYQDWLMYEMREKCMWVKCFWNSHIEQFI